MIRSKSAVFCFFLVYIVSSSILLPDTTLAPPVITPFISSINPPKIITKYPPNPAEVRIKGGGFIPAGSPLADLNLQKVYMRYGSQGAWVNAPMKIPGPWGWGSTSFSARLPSFNYVPGVIQVKVIVRGLESKIFEIPVILPASPTVPKITAISPSKTVVGQNGYYFIIRIYGSGIDKHTVPYFQGMPHPTQSTDYLEQWTQVAAPEGLRSNPGRYTIQLRNDQGYSNMVFWDLLVKPKIFKVEPGTISQATIAANAPPVRLKIGFEKSPPDKVWFRADNKNWQSTTDFKIISYHVSVALNIAGMKPENYVEIKLSNQAGESNIMRVNVLKLQRLKFNKSPIKEP